MWNIPDNLIVLGCKQSKKHDTVVKVLKDYFEGMLHTRYTEWETDDQYIYYVLPYNRIVLKALEKFNCYLSDQISDITLIRYASYIYDLECYPNCHRYYIRYNSPYTSVLPPFLRFRLSIGEKLKLLSEIP